ncbi:ORF-94 [Teiidae poxvirus 1]|nr:ORF-94 [Teiidae poxvirus 1]
MDGKIRFIQVYDMLNKDIIFQQDIDKIRRSDYYILSYYKTGKLYEVHSFDTVTRIDSGNIYQRVKHVFRNREDYLLVLFPSADILRSFNEETSVNVEKEAEKPPVESMHPKMILLDLFNGFKSNKPCYYYYYTLENTYTT